MIPASPLQRIGARFIEGVLIFAIPTLTCGACSVAMDGARSEAEGWMPFLWSFMVGPGLMFSVVHLVLTASAGGTLGKRAMGLRVCSLDGEPASLWRLLGRELLFFLGLSVGVIPVIDLYRAFVRPDARGLSDLLLGTQIMKVSEVQSAP